MKRVISFVCIIAVMTMGMLAFESVSSRASAQGNSKSAVSATVKISRQHLAKVANTSAKKATKKYSKKSGKAKKVVKKPKTRKISSRFKITFYSGDVLGYRGAGGKLTPKKSVAMNRSQMKRLGLSYGDKIYINSKRNSWDGWYEIRDCGCSSGVIDIFVAQRSHIPSWGVERGVEIAAPLE